MRSRTMLVCFSAVAAAALGMVLPAAAAPQAPAIVAYDSMPGNQYQPCRTHSVSSVNPLSYFAAYFTVRSKATQAVLTLPLSATSPVSLRVSIEGNRVVQPWSTQQWGNTPNDAVVLGRARIYVSQPYSPCAVGKIYSTTVKFTATNPLRPGTAYWVVLRTPAKYSGSVTWYAGPDSQIGNGAVSEYAEIRNGQNQLVVDWFTSAPPTLVPAMRVKIRN